MNTTRTNVPAARSSETYPSVFGDFFNNYFTTPFNNYFATPFSSAAADMTPALDVVENPEGFVMKLDLPGMTQDQVNVQLADNILTVQGERSEESKREQDRWHIVERTRGSFARSIKFPTNVDPSRVKALMKNGVLTVSVPKTESAKTQKIKIAEE